MRHYEITFLVDPVLSDEGVKATAKLYLDFLKGEGCEIVHVDEWGLKQLTYPIKKRSNAYFYIVEVACENGNFVQKLEIAFRRDERIIRYMSASLDKFGVQYNIDKRAGRIGKKKKESATDSAAETPVSAPVEKVAPVIDAPIIEEIEIPVLNADDDTEETA